MRPQIGALGLAALLLAAAAAACASGGNQVTARPGGVVVSSVGTGWATKKVVQRMAPETLLAEDGTICRVSPDRFKETAPGTLVRCNWQ